jgi:hypothetical protein
MWQGMNDMLLGLVVDYHLRGTQLPIQVNAVLDV